MEKLVKGEVVVIPFPFSDLSASKKRPALVIASVEGDDVILCQITSKMHYDKHSITLENIDFTQGNLQQPSMIRPNKIFTAHLSLISHKVGSIKESKRKEIEQVLIRLFTR